MAFVAARPSLVPGRMEMAMSPSAALPEVLLMVNQSGTPETVQLQLVATTISPTRGTGSKKRVSRRVPSTDR